MDLNEAINQLLMLRQLLESQDRDPMCVNLYQSNGKLVQSFELKDDGSQQDNLDVHIKA